MERSDERGGPAGPVDVLAFAPHPDDLELGCGGTIIRLVDAGYRVGLIDLTRGERGTRGTPEIRAAEAEEGRRILGAAFRQNLGLPDLGVDARSPAQLKRVVEAIRRHRPHLVFICSERDRHPDHIEAAGLVERAVYVAGLVAFEAAGEPWRPERLAFYMGRLVFEPRFIVDISSVIDRKMAAATAFQSQFFRDPDDPLKTPISEPGFLERVKARYRFFGGRIGVPFGEPFDMREPLGIETIDALVPGMAAARAAAPPGQPAGGGKASGEEA